MVKIQLITAKIKKNVQQFNWGQLEFVLGCMNVNSTNLNFIIYVVVCMYIDAMHDGDGLSKKKMIPDTGRSRNVLEKLVNWR